MVPSLISDMHISLIRSNSLRCFSTASPFDFASILLPENKQKRITKLGKVKSFRPVGDASNKNAAILVPIVEIQVPN